MKYITVKLTENQVTYLQILLNSEQLSLIDEGANPNHGMIAFIRRIRTKLVKAKNE